MGNKVWLTGAVRSTKYSRIVEIYPNSTTLGTFQTGTIGEFGHAYYPTEVDSEDCAVDSDPGGSFTYTAEHDTEVPAMLIIKIGDDIALATTANASSITPIGVTADTNIYSEIKNFQPLILEEGRIGKFKILITNITGAPAVIMDQVVTVSDTTTTSTNYSFLAEAENTYTIELSTYIIEP